MTDAPASTALTAADRPAAPAPTITTSAVKSHVAGIFPLERSSLVSLCSIDGFSSKQKTLIFYLMPVRMVKSACAAPSIASKHQSAQSRRLWRAGGAFDLSAQCVVIKKRLCSRASEVTDDLDLAHVGVLRLHMISAR